jgi:galactokinase
MKTVPEELRTAFSERYGEPVDAYVVEAPGRVNLMGDHIDYNGLSVLPMAMQRHMSVLYRERTDRVVRIASTDTRYEPREFELESTIEPFEAGDWGNYVKAAAQGIVERFEFERGLDAVVHSDIPIAAGLSSSSALVVASALAVLHANDHEEVERLELAELLAEAEHYVGTRGGGMDHAICLAARRHSASRIDFLPLRLTAHPIPPEWHFILANSLVRAEKSGAALKTYNARTRECRKALAVAAKALGRTHGIDSYTELLQERSSADLLKAAEGALDGVLYRRFRHVITEGDRVHRAERTLYAYDLKGFGHLMTESHHSLRDDFEVSSPELDELVDIATRAGAAGARPTGAGLGGCVVALCEERKAGKVLKSLKTRFYNQHDFEGRLEDQVFVAEPSGGATVSAL